MCDQGYFGTYCDFKGNELQNLRSIVFKMVDHVLTLVQSRYSVRPFDIEVTANVVRGVTANPDLVDDETFDKIVSLLEYIGNATIYAHRPIDNNVTAILMEAFSNSIMKINHSFKLRRSSRDTLLLGMGLGLQQFSNSF